MKIPLPSENETFINTEIINWQTTDRLSGIQPDASPLSAADVSVVLQSLVPLSFHTVSYAIVDCLEKR